MSQKAKIQKHAVISIVGLGMSVGALATVVPLPALVLFAVGIGIMLGGILKGLHTLVERAE